MAETKFLDNAGLTHLFEKINAKFSKIGHKHTKADITDFAHSHNDLYYGKTEVDSKLSGKSNTGHNHDDRYYTESEINTKLNGKLTKTVTTDANLDNHTKTGYYVVRAVPSTGGNESSPVDRWASVFTDADIGAPFQIAIPDGASSYLYKRALNSSTWKKMSAGYADTAGSAATATTAATANAVAWNNISGKPNTYTPSSHTHNYAGSSSAGGNANWANGSTYANYAFSNNGVSTSGSGSAYTATVSGFSLATGKSIVMIPHVTSTTTTPTLNVSGTGAKNIRMRLSSSTSSTIPLIRSNFLTANKPVKVTYDGTYWVIDDFIQPDANNLYGTLISRGSSAPSSGTAGFIYIQTT